MTHFKGVEQPRGFRNNSKIRRVKKAAAKMNAAIDLARFIAAEKARKGIQ